MDDILIAIAIIWFIGTVMAFVAYATDSLEDGIGISAIEVMLALFWLPIAAYIFIIAFFNTLSRYLHVKKRR